jgi:hypothetical protein
LIRVNAPARDATATLLAVRGWRPVAMENVLFLVMAVVLYFASDAIVQAVELRLGRRLEHRTLLFFVLLLGLALASFALVRQLFAS